MILLTGATGYVGQKLLKIFQEQGLPVRCFVRKKIPNAEFFVGDVLDKASILKAMDGVDVAYYLIHSMGSKGDFAEMDRQAAKNFAEAASEKGVKRIIYLGGLSDPGDSLSKHLKSRLEVGEILRESTAQVIEFRASIVIGSGSLSFEMVRCLTERLPLMITPKWVFAKAQPIAISDLLTFLEKARTIEVDDSPIFEIGGKDIVSYADVMKEYGKQRGLKRLMIPVPVITPYLSSLWLALVTPVYSKVGMKLIESACCHSVVRHKGANQFFGVKPMGIEKAIHQALESDDQSEGRIIDVQEIDVDASLEEAFAPIAAIGGKTGWYYGNFLWRVRGVIDQLLGGVGIRRGRADELKGGDMLDFWRVEVFDPPYHLRLKAEMKLPGHAWLDFTLEPHNGKTRIRQTAIFDPKGLLGLAYWYLLYPIHFLVFRGMLKNIGLKI